MMVAIYISVIATIIGTLIVSYFRRWLPRVAFAEPLKALIALFSDGRFRGLWQDEPLDEQIRNAFKSSPMVRVKATKANELFHEEGNNNFKKCLLDRAFHARDKQVRVLLHCPCLKSTHVQDRIIAHGKNPDTAGEEFLNYWFDTLTALHNYWLSARDAGCTVQVHFYREEHHRWRFYLFTGDKPSRELLFLNYYDRHVPGADTPMYKVTHGPQSLQSDFSRYFDDIWEAPPGEREVESVDAFTYLNEHFGNTGSALTPCKDCAYLKICKRVLNQRKPVIKMTEDFVGKDGRR
jgi:hypothetical protein